MSSIAGEEATACHGGDFTWGLEGKARAVCCMRCQQGPGDGRMSAHPVSALLSASDPKWATQTHSDNAGRGNMATEDSEKNELGRRVKGIVGG